MRAAILHEYGVPRAGEFEDPVAGPERAVVEVTAAGVNPVDATISAGRFYGGRPTLPSIAGREGVGTLDGERVYFDAPMAPFGSMAERALIDPRATYRVPDDVDDGVAVALGISGLAAWLALTWRAQLRAGEHVLVLGASASPQAIISSAAVRGKMLVIMGHTNFAAPPEIKAKAYDRMAQAAARGELRVGVLPMPLERVEEAWRKLQAGAHRKIVLVP